MLFEGVEWTGFISFSFNSHLTLDKIDTVY